MHSDGCPDGSIYVASDEQDVACLVGKTPVLTLTRAMDYKSQGSKGFLRAQLRKNAIALEMRGAERLP